MGGETATGKHTYAILTKLPHYVWNCSDALSM